LTGLRRPVRQVQARAARGRASPARLGACRVRIDAIGLATRAVGAVGAVGAVEEGQMGDGSMGGMPVEGVKVQVVQVSRRDLGIEERKRGKNNLALTLTLSLLLFVRLLAPGLELL
jgi:hypothetical protein